MFDSDSDSNASILNQTESSDIQLLDEARQDQLQEDNASLVKEINVLRAQFEQAVAISKKSDEYVKEIDSLKQQLYDANAAKEDISRRLEISIRAKEEALKRLEDEQAKNSAQRAADVKAMQKELSKTKKSFQSKIDLLYSQNQKLQAEKDADDVAQKTLVGKIDKLVLNSSHFLGKEVSSFDELCSIIETTTIQKVPQIQKIQVKPESTRQVEPLFQGQNEAQQQQIKEISKKLKKTKQELKASLMKISELNTAVTRKDAEIDQIKFKNQAEIDSLTEKMNAQKEDFERAKADSSAKIQQLNEKIETLKADVAKKGKQIKEKRETKEKVVQPTIQQPVPVFIQQADKNKDDKLISDQLNARIEELTTQLSISNKTNEELKEKLLESEKVINNLNISHENEHNELAALKTVHKETLREIETIRAALHARRDTHSKKEIDINKKEQQRQKAAILQLENTNEELKKHVFEVQLENEKHLHTINEQNQQLGKAKAENSDLREKLSALSNEITDMKQARASAIPQTEEDFFPRSMWTSGDFESSLAQNIAKVASNDALSAPSKLQHIYRAIQKFYSKQIAAIKDIAEEANNDSQRMYSYMNDFIVSLTIALNDKAESFDRFMQNAAVPAALVSRVTDLRTSIIDLKRSNDVIQQNVDAFAVAFDLSTDTEINTQISIIKSQINKQNEMCENAKNKAKKLKEERNELQQKYDAEVIPLKTENEGLKVTLESTNEIVNKHAETIRKLRAELAESKRTQKDLESKLETTEEKHNEKMEEFEEAKEEEITSLKESYEEKMKEMTKELDSLKAAAAAVDEQIAKYTKAIEAQKETISEKEAVIQQTIEQGKANEEKLTKNFSIEKSKLIESYEKAVAELKEQCDKHRNDIVKLSSELARMEKKCKETKALAIQLKREATKLEKEKKLKEEEFERESKIAESTAKSAIVNVESQCTAKLNEQRTKFESEKRKILSFVADEFREFFNACDSLDERSFHSIITRAKDELTRLQKMDSSIRRIVGATGRQTTDDAVAQIVMGN